MPTTLFPKADPATRARLDADPAIHLANNFDWSSSPLGPVCDWPETLRAAVRFVLTSDTPMVLLAGSADGVLIYNTGYAIFAGDRHPAVFGQPVLEAWPEIAEFNAQNMRRGFAGESWSLANQELKLDRRGSIESAWMNLSYSPVLGEDGVPVAIAVIVQETTAQMQAEAARADSESRFRVLADTMPQMVWSTLPDGFHDYYNARWYEFTGVPEGSTDGEGWNGMFHPEDQARAWEVWRKCLATGDAYKIEYRLRHRSGEYRWVLGQALPMRDVSGRIVRWFGTCTDIHETKILVEEREVIAQELSHRIKNIFSVITGIVALSARSQPEFRDYSDRLRDRILALGRAHDFVRPHSNASKPHAKPDSFADLFSELMRPYQSGGDVVVFTGDDTRIDDRAATPLALIFHELATNSAKYGALSSQTGSVELNGRLDGAVYELVWQEKGGPVVAEPSEGHGFGTRLIKLSAESQLRGSIERRWESDGLRIELKLPLASLSRN